LAAARKLSPATSALMASRVAGESGWAPPWEAPLRSVATKNVEGYYRAYRSFARLLDDVVAGRAPGLVEAQLQPGEAGWVLKLDRVVEY
jgi:hypothetical protein